MSDIDYCPICNEFGFMSRHKCKPLHLVFEVYDYNPPFSGDFIPDDTTFYVMDVYARDLELAAEKAMSQDSEWYECNPTRYAVILKSDVEVNDDGDYYWPDGKYKVFEVEARLEPIFNAVEVK